MLLVRQWIHVPASLRVSHTFYVNVNSDPEVTPWLSLSTETGTHSENCAAALPVEMAQVQFLDNLLTRYVQRQVLWSRCSLGQGVRPFFPRHVHYWSRQCRKPWNCKSCRTVVLTSLRHAATRSAVLATRTVEGPQIQSSTGCS